jgi:hypothetical protein
MIGSAIIYSLGLVLQGILVFVRDLDDVVVNPSIIESIDTVNTWAATLYAYVPLESIFICLGILILWEKWWAIYQVGRWLWQKIPGLN